MMKIIKLRERIHNVYYQLFFEYKNQKGAGFAFDCDEHGNVKDPGHVNYLTCINAANDLGVKKPEIHTYHNDYSEPAIGLCKYCNEEVELHGFTNTCECGVDYNMSGQELASRDQWGEDTFESVSDILSIDYNSSRDYDDLD